MLHENLKTRLSSFNIPQVTDGLLLLENNQKYVKLHFNAK